MNFQQFKDVIGQIDPDMIWYTDDNGQRWSVPQGHRFWLIYQEWIAQGDTPLPAS